MTTAAFDRNWSNFNVDAYDEELENKLNALRNGVCWAFVNHRSCKYGASCRFLHLSLREVEQRERLIREEFKLEDGHQDDAIDNLPVADRDDGNDAQSDLDDDEEDPDAGSECNNVNVDEEKSNVCFAFRKTGSCMFGDRCRFEHVNDNDVEGGRSAGEEEDEEDNQQQQDAESEQEENREDQLRHDRQQGAGDEEEAQDIDQDNGGDENDQRCRAYLWGNCHNGDNCPWLHIPGEEGSLCEADTDDEQQQEQDEQDQDEDSEEEQSGSAAKRDIACAVCYHKRRSVVLRPCRHFVLCGKCADIILRGNSRRCPMCRSPIEGVLSVYL